jgi:hypothetical protein
MTASTLPTSSGSSALVGLSKSTGFHRQGTRSNSNLLLLAPECAEKTSSCRRVRPGAQQRSASSSTIFAAPLRTGASMMLFEHGEM